MLEAFLKQSSRISPNQVRKSDLNLGMNNKKFKIGVSMNDAIHKPHKRMQELHHEAELDSFLVVTSNHNNKMRPTNHKANDYIITYIVNS